VAWHPKNCSLESQVSPIVFDQIKYNVIIEAIAFKKRYVNLIPNMIFPPKEGLYHLFADSIIKSDNLSKTIYIIPILVNIIIYRYKYMGGE